MQLRGVEPPRAVRLTRPSARYFRCFQLHSALSGDLGCPEVTRVTEKSVRELPAGIAAAWGIIIARDENLVPKGDAPPSST